MTTKYFALMILIGMLLSLSACVKVKAWEKGNFTKSHMAFEPDPLRAKFFQHTYESREAASGGYGVSVVGCGCK